MSIFKQRLSHKTKIQICVATAVVFALAVLLGLDIFLGGPLTTFLSRKDEITSTIQSFGIFAPIAFILFQTIQTILAPIPGQVTGFIGGFVFGWWGVLWTLIGTSIGFLAVFLLSRRFGRSLVEKIIKKSALDKFDSLTREKGTFVFFLIFLIPGLPDDIVCYIAGLTDIPVGTLMALITLGRLPAVIMTNFIGAGIGEDDITPVVIASVISAITLAVVYIKREKIMSLTKQNEEKSED